MTILYLVAANESEADEIAASLLEQKLIACAKKFETKSIFRWQGEIKKASEVILLLETEDRLFDEIEKEIAKVHSHKTFVLASIPTDKVSRGVKEWLEEELKQP
ncbi:MAG: CutA1 divalent ion tolerance protein [Parcubacteria group bacterium GW2011_GWB1_45_7]|uniref:Divalent-cation tolerance protein CutA n=2 Tax=Candidatus Colwelliibacteriota TaxID=1817904 RepID=A0A1G1ZC42_9BACT|nr:MAG: CutA1 divalent ion tolerance protein [Parcubacteria group bacterium GW2011_GWB1_45_7]OGY57411.1 MAG: hypothetical protein A3C03_02245 [Candidatus Colwellbacteria bacterium RIFCSPHIGHO2_02_FULL_45_17]OGY60800.1 MAG: hypothetical protein A3I33_02490 [Candidatus Colwellbacteria bacterium RIFCSPLOWO2_02_FULL_45_11]OGY62084.1 MAG: hypothetical protein A3G58_01925 [Candidatus Colwellbacteria bacterium RIFCSPLOWO2_12_FULL_46_17]